MKKSYKSYRDGTYLSKADVNPPVTWCITSVVEKTIAAPNKPPKLKLVAFFDGSEKGLILNMSQCEFLAQATESDNPEEWIGYDVELYVDPDVVYSGKKIGGIRLRVPQGAPA
jgi:hypothetical protein